MAVEGIQGLVTAIARAQLWCAASIRDGRSLFMEMRAAGPKKCTEMLRW